MQFDQHERRARDVGEHAALHAACGQRVAEELTVAQQFPVAAQHRARMQRTASLRVQRLLHARVDQPQQQHGRATVNPEDRTPAGGLQHRAADQWRQDRRQPHHEHQRGKGAGGLACLEPVADHGTRHHQPRAAAQRLQEAPDHQRFHARCQRAAGGGHAVDHQARVKRRLASETVADRPVECLPDGQPDQERAQRQLHPPDVGMQVGGQRGKAGQVHVNG